MSAEFLFAAGYLACALIAVMASRIRPTSEAAAAGPFWLRVAVISGAFAVLRVVNAQMAVNAAVQDFSHSAGLTDWMRPGPYLMLVAIGLLGLALAGLYMFRLRALHRSVNLAAIAIVLLVLLAVAHSLSLQVTAVVLQAQLGELTVSRIIEAVLLLMLAISGLWFILAAKRNPNLPIQR